MKTVWLAALLILTSCRRDAKQTSPDELARQARSLVSEDAINGEVKAIEEARARDRARVCVRPVLRGAALPGRAGPQLSAMLEGKEHAPCHQLLSKGKGGARLFQALFEPSRAPFELVPMRQSPDPAVVRSIVKVCEPALARLTAALQRGDACTPFSERWPREPGRMVAINMVLAARAWELLREDEPASDGAAASLLLDGLRYGQDLARGQAGPGPLALSTTASLAPVPVLANLLGRARPLASELLLRIERELGVLLESEPPVADYLRGYELDDGLHSVRELQDRARPRDERGGVVLVRRAWRDVLAARLQVCPPTASLESCVAGIQQVARKARSEAEATERAVRGRMAAPKGDPRALLEEVQLALVAIFRGRLSAEKTLPTPLLVRVAQRRFLLAALRLHAAARRLAADACAPTRDALQREPLRSLAVDPTSGRPLTVTAERGGLRLAADRSFPGAERRFEYLVRWSCPR